VAALYLVIGHCFWFRAPNAGIAAATVAFATAALLG
jgi:hypothetical protein